MFRIQKLLLCEYKDFEETVLIESPFAQVTEFGIGIKQVQIALTSTKLIIGNDTFDKSKTNDLTNVLFDNQDPEVETMELNSMFPLEFLYIKVFRRGTRQIMKVSVGTAKILWFEFGGHLLKNMYWNIWRERISALRAQQPRFQPFDSPTKTTPITSSTTTLESIPEPQLVQAEVHRENSDIKLNGELNISPSKRFNTLGSYKIFPKRSAVNMVTSQHGQFDRNSAMDLQKYNQEMVLREVAEYFMETQSDIVIGQHTFGFDSCGGNCRNFLFRSASVANLMNAWDTNYHGF
ncbi:unnamed protein product [Hermetia illucens]|uniref:Uncharacterized protein n=1 Tax=Hermetia illucens TaxID=343691 RepID=A0A7R8Z058_HERIL|nr:uncharacterized protein LOC119657561 [Hermetia illucens]CAD7091206.1 unnamed protein product [Hermetia illucens]